MRARRCTCALWIDPDSRFQMNSAGLDLAPAEEGIDYEPVKVTGTNHSIDVARNLERRSASLVRRISCLDSFEARGVGECTQNPVIKRPIPIVKRCDRLVLFAMEIQELLQIELDAGTQPDQQD